MEDDLVLNQLKQRAEAAVPQLPSIFAANGVQFPSGDGGYELDRDIWSHVQTGDFQSALVCVRRVPFAMHSTSAVIWETLSYPDKSFASEENSRHEVAPVAHVLERLPNVCAMKFRGEIRGESGDFMHLDCHTVVHRTEMGAPYNSSVFVWQSFSKLAGGDIEYRETMWAAVTRCPSGGLESIVTVVSQSQLETVDRIGDASSLLALLIPATDAYPLRGVRQFLAGAAVNADVGADDGVRGGYGPAHDGHARADDCIARSFMASCIVLHDV